MRGLGWLLLCLAAVLAGGPSLAGEVGDEAGARAAALPDTLYFRLGPGNFDAKARAEARRQVKKHREVKVIDDVGIAPFHPRRAEPLASARRPLCSLCHLELPHRRSARTRAFLNQHTRFVACETCHLQAEGVRFDYAWLRFGPPPAAPAARPEEKGRVPSLVPDRVSRIAPRLDGRPALLFADEPAAKAIGARWEQGDLAAKTTLKLRLHGALAKKGRRCQDCHGRRQRLLDLPALGADPRQVQALADNPIARFLGRDLREEQRLRLTELLR